MNSREYPEHKTSTFSYEKFSTYLEKEKQTLEKILKILAKNQNEKEFFLNEFLPSLEEARKIWKSSWNFRTGYHDALKFLTTKWEKSLRNTFGEPIIDPESHLKPLFLKYSNGNYEDQMGKLYQEYEKELEKSNSLDFDDLLLLPYQLFKKNPEALQKWQNNFDYILVDEAQDTNWIQFELSRESRTIFSNSTTLPKAEEPSINLRSLNEQP